MNINIKYLFFLLSFLSKIVMTECTGFETEEYYQIYQSYLKFSKGVNQLIIFILMAQNSVCGFENQGGRAGQQSEVRAIELNNQIAELKSERKNNSTKDHSCIKICVLFTALVLVVVIGLNFYYEHVKEDQKLREKATQLSNKIVENEGKEKQQTQKIQDLETEVNQKKMQIEELVTHQQKHMKEEKNVGGQKVPSVLKYIVNEKIPQTGGLKPRAKGTASAIKYLSTDQKNQTVDQVLYKTDYQRKQRVKMHKDRKSFVQRFINKLESIEQTFFNMKVDRQDDEYEARKLEFEYNRVNPIHGLESVTTQLPMCIISPSFKNNANFRIEYSLNSIFTQNYSNYYAVITDDSSGDGSDEVYRKYFQFYKIPASKYIYINNTKRKGAMENDYNANHLYCSEDAISVHLDGDDQFIGRNVLKIFNAQYQKLKAGALYSNFLFYSLNKWANNGFTNEYPQHIKDQNKFRTSPMYFSHLKTYRTQIFRKIDKSYFLDSRGNFFGFASDVVFFIPIMELVCGRVHKIQGFHYLYHRDTGLNEDIISRPKQAAADQESRRKLRLRCDEEWKKKVDGKSNP